MNQDLMREAGFGGGAFQTYKSLTIDNGADISGTDATGEFAEISYDEKDQRSKKLFGKELTGVILSSKAILTYRDKTQTKKKVWESEEFNPMLTKKRDGAKALIPLYQLDFNGQRQKDDNGKSIVEYAFYEDLKLGKEQKLKGMDFVYTIVLYVLIKMNDEDSEIVKLKFRGKGRGNLFNYQKKLFKDYRLNLPQVVTNISTYLEKSYGKHAVAFSVATNEDGQPKRPISEEQINERIESLIEGAKTKLSMLVAPNETNILKLKNPTSDVTAIESAPTKSPIDIVEEENTNNTGIPTSEDTPPIEAYEKDEEADSNEIKIEDIPIK